MGIFKALMTQIRNFIGKEVILDNTVSVRMEKEVMNLFQAILLACIFCEDDCLVGYRAMCAARDHSLMVMAVSKSETSAVLHGATSKKTVTFMLAVVRT
jgi:hypothetical protein